MKKILCIFATLTLVFLVSALPVHANSVGPEPWKTAYFEVLKEYYDTIRKRYGSANADHHAKITIPPYIFLDFEQDGVPELIINPGNDTFDNQNPLRIYTYADAGLREYSVARLDPFPDGYRNKQTGEMKWIQDYEDIFGDTFREEMVLVKSIEFDSFDLVFVELPYREEKVRNFFDSTYVERVEWWDEGEKISRKQYKKALKEWGDTYELVIPHDAYSGHLNQWGSPNSKYRNYDDLWQEMLEAIDRVPKAGSVRTGWNPIFWGAAALGVLLLAGGTALWVCKRCKAKDELVKEKTSV